METTPLREARRAHGLTLFELAEKAKCNPAHLSRVERGIFVPSKALASRLFGILEGSVTRDQIMFPEEYASSMAGIKKTLKPRSKKAAAA